MRQAVIAGVLAAALPTLAQAQVKVALGDGVSVVFPAAPVKLHTTMDSPAEPTPAPRAPGVPPMPVPPDFRDFGSADSWMLHQGGASFTAMAMSPRGAHADLPARCGPLTNRSASGAALSCRVLGSGPTAVREERRVFEGGDLMISRSISRGGRYYTVRYLRLAPQKLATLNAKNATPSEAAGDSFLASFSVEGPAAR